MFYHALTHKPTKTVQGFTLAELLISLAILGVIATFTIPKILVAQQNASYNAAAKEAAGMISAAYQQIQQNGQLQGNTSTGSFTSYFNYLSVDTASTSAIDDIPGGGAVPCNSRTCIRLHNGGVLQYQPSVNFGGTNTTNSVYFTFDPDGKVTDGTTNGPGKGLVFNIQYNGRLSTQGQKGYTCNSANCNTGSPNQDPTWFNNWN